MWAVCLSLLLTLSAFLCVLAEEKGCIALHGKLSCEGSIPLHIPTNMDTVLANRVSLLLLTPEAFSHHSWSNVAKLDLYTNTEIIKNDTFENLKNLRELGIHSRDLRDVHTLALNGLNRLVKLDLSGCLDLTLDVLVTALVSVETPELRVLNLQYLNSIYYNSVIINDRFLDMLKTKAIRHLDMSGTNIYLSDLSLNISAVVEELHISNITLAYNLNQKFVSGLLEHILKNLRRLNVSHTSERIFGGTGEAFPRNDVYVTVCPEGLLATIEAVYVDFVSRQVLNVRNSTIDIKCKMNMSIIHLRGNKMKYMNMTIYWPKDNKINVIRLSRNTMEYLSPNFFTGLYNLRILDLEMNNLWKMQRTSEFENLLKHLSSLEELDMSQNGLSWVPQNLVFNLIKLHSVNLSQNNLKVVSLSVSSLYSLHVMNFEKNEILYFSDSTSSDFQSLIDYTKVENRSVYVKLDDNPLECSCRSVHFVQLLVAITRSKPDQTFTCSFGSREVDIDENALHKSQYLCVKNVIIISAFVVSFVVIALGLVIAYLITRHLARKRRRQLQQMFIDNFKVGKEHKHFIAFLSYDVENDDKEEEDEIEVFMNHIDRKLGDMLGKADVALSFPDKHFRAGRRHADETLRCILEACVTLIKVSTSSELNFSFRTTLNLAQYYQRPVIFLTRAGVEYEHDLVKTSLERGTSIKMVINRVSQEPECDWQKLCNLIFKMALDNAGF